jgi:hypothetical protein
VNAQRKIKTTDEIQNIDQREAVMMELAIYSKLSRNEFRYDISIRMVSDPRSCSSA